MNYYYDIKLNFLEDNYMYYEWDKEDIIDEINKIPLYQVDSTTFNDFLCHNVKVESDFLEEIENKTLTKHEKLKYACIIADKNSAYAYEFNDEGKTITRSSLVLKDELSLLEYLYTLSIKKINYEKQEKLNISKNPRLEEKIKKFINLEIDKLYEEKRSDKLKFLYLEWFKTKEENIDTIYQKMKNQLKKEIAEKEINIWEIIKLSYNNV